jgi:hypothetical protein
MAKYFIVHLSQTLNAALQSPETKTIYKIAQKSGASFNTVKKYATGDVKTPYLTGEVMQLCEYFGLDWRDPAVVEEFTSEENESSGQIKTLHAVTA